MKKVIKKFSLIFTIVAILLVLTSCQGETPENEAPSKDEESKDVTEEKTDEDIILEYVQNMTLEEKIGQILMPALEGDKYTKEELLGYKLGGIILFQEDITTQDETKALIKDYQEDSNIPLFIGVDEEGGIVSRIAANEEMGYEPIPEAFDIGKTEDFDKAYSIGQSTGKMLSELGFNMNFAPVADIWTNPDNTVIGTRSFGTEEELVSKMLISTMDGLKDQNILAVTKHFPGHGDTKEDTHKERAFVNKSLEELEELEFVPFQKAIDHGIDGVMLGHIDVPKIDKDYPATLSSVIINDILKEDMGFKGLVITDALNMQSITDTYGDVEAAVLSFNAGADILLMPDIELVYDGLIDAYENGDISKKRLEESVYKILHSKYIYEILDISSFT